MFELQLEPRSPAPPTGRKRQAFPWTASGTRPAAPAPRPGSRTTSAGTCGAAASGPSAPAGTDSRLLSGRPPGLAGCRALTTRAIYQVEGKRPQVIFGLSFVDSDRRLLALAGNPHHAAADEAGALAGRSEEHT